MTKMTSHRFNINGYHSNSITRRPFLYTHEGRGSRRDQGGLRERRGNNQNWEESKKKRMGDLELGSSKCGECGGKEGEKKEIEMLKTRT